MTTRVMNWRSYGLDCWKRHAASIVVWLAAIAGVVGLMERRAARPDMPGLAQAEQRRVAALNDGRLALVPVSLFEPVRQGQTVAVLEDDRIKAALATTTAETARLRAELRAAEARLASEAESLAADSVADERRFVVNVEQTRLEILELNVTLETDRIRWRRLQIELERLNGLQRTDAASRYEYEIAETNCEEIEQTIAQNEKARTQLEADLTAAIERRDTFINQHPAPAKIEELLRPYREAVSVQEARVAELNLDRALHVLHSPVDGIVSELLRGTGETVLCGEPIVTVIAARSSEVIAYAMESQAAHIALGAPVELLLFRAGEKTQTAESTVIGIGPASVELPMRLWQNHQVPEWGWPVRIVASSELDMLTGEVVGVRLMHDLRERP